MIRSITRGFGALMITVAVTIGVFAGPAEALNPETKDVQTVVNTEYWDSVKLWKPIMNHFNYPYFNPGVRYYNFYNSSGQLVDYATPCENTWNAHGWEGFYCPKNQVIYVDYIQQQQNIRTYGDGAVAFWVNHEFAHHVQWLARTSGQAPWYELNADCLAGIAFKYGVSYTGNVNTSNDVAEARQNIWYGLSDTDADHGTRTQRLNAFAYGYQNFNYKQCNTW